MITEDCCANFINPEVNLCGDDIFSRSPKGVYFNPKTKEVFADKELKILLGHGEINGDVLIITKTTE